MKLKYFFSVILGCLLIVVCAPISQAATVDLNQLSCDSPYFYPQTFDNLIVDFSLDLDQADTLNSLVLKNEGTARNNYEITKVVLYADSGNNQFDGLAVDQKLAEASYYSADDQWVFNNLNYAVPAFGKKFFVTIEAPRNGVNNRSYIFTIPAYSDGNSNGLYDPGETGLFLANTSGLPSAKLADGCSATYRTATYDSLDPVSVITNLTQNQQISDNSYKIEGQTKDQGGSSPQWVRIWINDIWQEATITEFDDSGLYFWNFQWSNISPGNYSVKVEASDWNDNSGFGKTSYTVNVVAPSSIDFSKSFFSYDRMEVTADGRDFAILGYDLVDSSNNPVAGETVEIKTDQSWVTFDKKIGTSDSFGRIRFIVKSTVSGEAVFKPWVNGEERPSSATIDFVDEPTPGYFDLNSGKLVKILNNTAVYFVDNLNTKHVFPTQKVYESYFGQDFSKVKIITQTEMQSYVLGANMTFKEGTLFKVPTITKVYKVEKFNKVRWIEDEPTAKALYGANWESLFVDLPEAFWGDYTEDEAIKL